MMTSLSTTEACGLSPEQMHVAAYEAFLCCIPQDALSAEQRRLVPQIARAMLVSPDAHLALVSALQASDSPAERRGKPPSALSYRLALLLTRRRADFGRYADFAHWANRQTTVFTAGVLFALAEHSAPLAAAGATAGAGAESLGSDPSSARVSPTGGGDGATADVGDGATADVGDGAAVAGGDGASADGGAASGGASPRFSAAPSPGGASAATAPPASIAAAGSGAPSAAASAVETRWLLRRRYMAILRTLAAPEALFDEELYAAAICQLRDAALPLLARLTGAAPGAARSAPPAAVGARGCLWRALGRASGPRARGLRSVLSVPPLPPGPPLTRARPLLSYPPPRPDHVLRDPPRCAPRYRDNPRRRTPPPLYETTHRRAAMETAIPSAPCPRPVRAPRRRRPPLPAAEAAAAAPAYSAAPSLRRW